MRFAWKVLGLSLLAMTGCEDGINFCTDNNRDDAGQCREIPDFPTDGGLDANTPPSDASTPPDAFVPDTSLPADASGLDATVDAGTDATTPPASLNVEEYCAAQYATAVAWRDKFEQCCATAQTAADERSAFLFGALLYDDGTQGNAESVANCVDGINRTVGANLTYVGTAAGACAAKFASQFTAPPVDCPATGFAIEQLEATNGHRAQATTQLAECRATFAGKVALNGTCTTSFECASGNRCLGPDGQRTCRPALSMGNACTATSQCADGFICQGASGAGKSCQPVNAPVAVSSNCTLSTECESGYLCLDGKCALPAATLFCAQ